MTLDKKLGDSGDFMSAETILGEEELSANELFFAKLVREKVEDRTLREVERIPCHNITQSGNKMLSGLRLSIRMPNECIFGFSKEGRCS